MITFRNLFKVFSKQQPNDDIDFWGHWKATTYFQKPTFPLVFCVKKPGIYQKIDKKFAESLSILDAKSCLGCSVICYSRTLKTNNDNNNILRSKCMSNVCRKKWYGNLGLYSGLKMSRRQIFSRGKCCSTGGYLDAAGCSGRWSLVRTFPRETFPSEVTPHATSSLRAWPDWNGPIETMQLSQWWSSSRAEPGKLSCQVDSAAANRRSVNHKTKRKFIRIQVFPEENNIILCTKFTSIAVINTCYLTKYFLNWFI
jgi:hypothetical protein